MFIIFVLEVFLGCLRQDISYLQLYLVCIFTIKTGDKKSDFQCLIKCLFILKVLRMNNRILLHYLGLNEIIAFYLPFYHLAQILIFPETWFWPL